MQAPSLCGASASTSVPFMQGARRAFPSPGLVLGPVDRLEINPLLEHFPERTQFSQFGDMSGSLFNAVVDLLFGCKSSDAKSDGRVGHLIVGAQCSQHVRWLEGSRRACRPRGQGNVFERHQQGFSLYIAERNVDASGAGLFRISIPLDVRHLGRHSRQQSFRQLSSPLAVVLTKCKSSIQKNPLVRTNTHMNDKNKVCMYAGHAVPHKTHHSDLCFIFSLGLFGTSNSSLATLQAVPRPTTSGHGSVPERRPLSCPPPVISGLSLTRGLLLM